MFRRTLGVSGVITYGAGRSGPPTSGLLTASASHLVGPMVPLGVAEDPPAELSRTSRPARRLTPLAQPEAACGWLEAFIYVLLEASDSTLILRLNVLRSNLLDRLGRDPAPPAPAVRPGARGLRAMYPDAGWHALEGDDREREDETRGSRLRRIPGRWRPSSPPWPGCLVRRPRTRKSPSASALALPGQDPGGTIARVLASVAARGHKAGWRSIEIVPRPRARPGRSSSLPGRPGLSVRPWITA